MVALTDLLGLLSQVLYVGTVMRAVRSGEILILFCSRYKNQVGTLYLFWAAVWVVGQVDDVRYYSTMREFPKQPSKRIKARTAKLYTAKGLARDWPTTAKPTQ